MTVFIQESAFEKTAVFFVMYEKGKEKMETLLQILLLILAIYQVTLKLRQS